MKIQKKKIAFLIFLSGLSLIYGLGYSFVVNEYSVIRWGISLIGFLGLIVCSLSLKENQPRETLRKDWRFIFRTILIIVLFLCLIVFINSLALQKQWRWDTTQFKQHTLSDKTLSFIKDIPEAVKITVLHVGIVPKYIEDLLREYRLNSSGKIETEIVDPIQNIGYAAQFGNMIDGQEKRVVVQSATGRQDINFTDKVLTENQINNALIRLSRKEQTAYFLAGHGEYTIDNKDNTGLTTFVEILASNNIKSKTLLLQNLDTIPEDCDLLVIAGPKNEFARNENKAIQNYLKAGGDALVLIENTIVTEPNIPLTAEQKVKNPALNEILEDWGLHVAFDVVVDLGSHASGDVGSPATKNYPKHDAIVKDLDYTFYVRPRSIAVVKGRRETIRLAPLVLTSTAATSWGETNRQLDVKFNENEDFPGPVAFAYIVWEGKEENEASDTRMIVFTDADFLTNVYIGHYSNAQMGLNVANWLLEADYEAFVEEKEIEVVRMDLTSKQKRIILVILVLMPLLIAFSGILLWLKKY